MLVFTDTFTLPTEENISLFHTVYSLYKLHAVLYTMSLSVFNMVNIEIKTRSQSCTLTRKWYCDLK